MPTSTEIKTLTIVTSDGNVTYSLNDNAGRALITALQTLVAGKQDTLVSGTNIKTVNNNSLLGSGNIAISGGSDTTILTYHYVNLTNTYSLSANFAENERGYYIFRLNYGTSAVNVTISLYNRYDNYLLLFNNTSYDLTVNLMGVSYNGTAVDNVFVPSEAIVIPSKTAVEISAACPDSTYAIITRSSELKITE